MEILNYKHLNKGVVQATFTLKIPKWGDFLIKEMTLMEKGEMRWVNFPQRPYETESGEKKYYAYVGFENFDITKKFQAEVLKVVDAFLSDLARKQQEEEARKFSISDAPKPVTYEDLPF